ncbi:MAG: FtsX-like permease family protein [Roseivirga sp.]|nr:FtsX-like permease family protein [Roseivirga sp.]
MSKQPPKHADRILSWCCRDELLEEIKGDLHEFYLKERSEKGGRRAWWLYWYHMLHFLRPFALKRIRKHSISFAMPFNNFKIAFRRLLRNKVHTAINVFGLSLGLTAFALILLFVRDEVSYDTFHEKPDQVVRLGVSLNVGGQIYNEASIPFPAAAALRDEYPDIEAAVRLFKDGNYPLLQYGDRKYIEEKLYFADTAFFKVFGFELALGNEATALSEPASILISESMAQKYFGMENPIGKTIKYQGETPLTVTGVVQKPTSNTHFKFDFLMPMAFRMAQWERITGLEGREKKWFWTGAWTYLRLSENTDKQVLASKLPAFLDKYFPDRYKVGSEFIVQPIRDIHLRSNLNSEMESNGNTIYVLIFAAIAFAVLFIACINFVNLNTIQAMNRVKEIGTRKAVGATRAHLVNLILSETFLITLLSVGIAAILFTLLLGEFNLLVDKELSLGLMLEGQNLLIFVSIILAVALLSGFYPAAIVSRLNTLKILKGTAKFGGRSSLLRKILITVQFVASIALIIGILVINRQLSHLNGKEIGYNRENLLIISARQDVNRQFDSFKNELLKSPDIKSVTAASSFPGYNPGSYRFVPEDGSRESPVGLPLTHTDLDYTRTMEIELLEGRDFDEASTFDKEQGFILNERAVAELGWEGTAVGKKLEHFGPGVSTIAKSGFVIGVIKDFHFESLHHDIRPIVLSYGKRHRFYMIRTAAGRQNDIISQVESSWSEFEKNWPMEYFSLDKELEKLYVNEQKLSQTIVYFAVVAVLIACIGLYSLAAFLITNRLKEIGIRKVLGASTRQVYLLVHKDFVWLILLANAIAWPLSFIFTRNWLQNFAYSSGFQPLYFLAAGLASLLLVVITTSYHTRKVNRIDLSGLLRNE